jgi:uncharacterized protein YndB with AHSA1/START domain
MITIESEIFVEGVTGREIFDFLLDTTDESYRRWWPGAHLSLHVLERHEDHVGDHFYMDEYIGKRRVRMKGVVVEAERGRKIVWQFRWGRILLPARLIIEMADRDGGVTLRHTITAGLEGLGRVLNPLFRIYFSERFASAMDEHVRTEFPMLRDMLTGSPQDDRNPGVARSAIEYGPRQSRRRG